jgi:hypothetical protein
MFAPQHLQQSPTTLLRPSVIRAMCASIQVKMQTSLSMYQGTSWAKVAISLWGLHLSGLLIPEMGPDPLHNEKNHSRIFSP